MNADKPEKTKIKPSHSLWSNIRYLMQLQWKNCRLSFVFLVILIPITIGCSYCRIFLARNAVYAVVERLTLIKIIGSIGVLCIVLSISKQRFPLDRNV
jgi:hypothetical protein